MSVLERLKKTVLVTRPVTAGAFDDVIESGDLDEKFSHDLGFDCFASLYETEPHLKPEAEQVDRVRAHLVNYLLQLESFRKTREHTVLNAPVSAALVPHFCEELKKAEDMVPPPPPPPAPPGEGEEETPKEAQDRRKRERQYKQGLMRAQQQLLSAATKASDAVEAMGMLHKMGWGKEPGQFLKSAVAHDHILRMLELLRNVHEWFGRIRSALAVAATKVVRKGVEVNGVKLGDDLKRVLPRELMLLDDPDTELLFWARYLQRRLLVRSVEGREPEMKRGDAVVLVDESGSMSGEPVAYAKAFAFAVRALLKQGGRRCVIASFSHDRSDMRVLPDDASEEDVLKWLASFIGGGTNFDIPLRFAAKVVAERELRQPDVIMLTDGVCEVSENVVKEFAAMKAATGARLWVFYFGAYNRSLTRLADAEHLVTLTDAGQAALEALAGVVV